jgi:hypothetical protein
MGLGLMLADLVARAHGGTLALPPVEAGFAVEMSFAAAAPRTPSPTPPSSPPSTAPSTR